MAISEDLCFVQLLHPGKEHTLSSGAGWNRGDHRRKYLRVNGHYLGEWEAESEVIEEFGRQGQGKPQRVWHPYYEKKLGYAGLQNTDPFVFGGFYRQGGFKPAA